MSPAEEEIVLPFPATIRPLRHLRSTVILASIATVRSRELFDDYTRALAPAHRGEVLEAVAGTWISLEAASAHYAACDALGLSVDQQVQCGRSTFDGTRDTLLGTVTRMARGAGVTPWQVFPMFQRFWDRGLDGGGISVTRVGPKDAHVTLVQCPLLASPHFRNGLRGLCTALTGLFCVRAFGSERRPARPASVVMRMQWA